MPLLRTLRSTLNASCGADSCVGYFNLRGWDCLDDIVDAWQGGSGSCCRLLIGMQRLPQDELRTRLSLSPMDTMIDNPTAIALKKRVAAEFKEQLMVGAPTNKDEAVLRQLSAQLKAKKVVVKLHLHYPLHAKLYLCHHDDLVAPIVGYLGSSNLTLSGLDIQGELNVDVLEQDAALKLQRWFDARWNDPWCLDISDELKDH